MFFLYGHLGREMHTEYANPRQRPFLECVKGVVKPDTTVWSHFKQSVWESPFAFSNLKCGNEAASDELREDVADCEAPCFNRCPC